jgi:hypothetical protein
MGLNALPLAHCISSFSINSHATIFYKTATGCSMYPQGANPLASKQT